MPHDRAAALGAAREALRQEEGGRLAPDAP